MMDTKVIKAKLAHAMMVLEQSEPYTQDEQEAQRYVEHLEVKLLKFKRP